MVNNSSNQRPRNLQDSIENPFFLSGFMSWRIIIILVYSFLLSSLFIHRQIALHQFSILIIQETSQSIHRHLCRSISDHLDITFSSLTVDLDRKFDRHTQQLSGKVKLLCGEMADHTKIARLDLVSLNHKLLDGFADLSSRMDTNDNQLVSLSI